jgi:rare lipoprotein A (peptidoglycan hydrolase)
VALVVVSFCVTLSSAGNSAQAAGPAECACKARSSSVIDQAERIVKLVKKTASAWPGSMRSGRATYYAGVPRGHGLKSNKELFAAAHMHVPFGICLIVTNTNNGKSVRLTTQDHGGLPAKHDKSGTHQVVLDLSIGAIQKIESNYKRVGVIPVTAIPCDEAS